METICENELDKSREEHKWKIKFLKTKNKGINVGVAPIDFDILSLISILHVEGIFIVEIQHFIQVRGTIN